MTHDFSTRGIVPGSLMACQIDPDHETMMRRWIENLSNDRYDQAYLLAVILGDDLD
jgi:hypothetical protein